MTLEDFADDPFIKEALRLRDAGAKGEKIARLASGEVVRNPQRDSKPPPEYVRAVRFHAINAVFDIWNEQVEASGEGRDIYIGDITKPVQDRVRFLASVGAWKWGIPSDLTVRRRVEEAANPKYYPETGRPAVACISEGYYRPSPFYLSPETRQAIREQVKASEILT
jgi:hypothetical protein